MWLTKQAELVLLRLENTAGLTETNFIAFETLISSTMKHSSEVRIQEVALLIERVRTQLNLYAEYDSHEFFMVALALRLFNALDMNILERFPGLLISGDRQRILARLVVRLQAHGLIKFEQSLSVGSCKVIGQLLYTILHKDTDELELFTSSLQVAEDGMNKLTRQSGLDVRFTYIPNSLAFIYCATPLLPEDKPARLERLGTIAGHVHNVAYDGISTKWARTLHQAQMITNRYNDEIDIYWKSMDLESRDMREFPLCLMAAQEDPLASSRINSIEKFLDMYILVDSYLKQNPDLEPIELDGTSLMRHHGYIRNILSSITGGVPNGTPLEAAQHLDSMVADLRSGYLIVAEFTFVPSLPRILPIPSVYAAQIRIYNTLNVLAVRFPNAESYFRAIAGAVHRNPFASNTHYYWLELYLSFMEVPSLVSTATVGNQWDFAGLCEITRRFGTEVIQQITNDPEAIRLTNHSCSLVRHFAGFPADWLVGNDPWLRNFAPFLSQHWRAMREFQKRPFGLGESVTGFIPGNLVVGGLYNPKTYKPLISWYYSQNAALGGKAALRGLSISNIPIPSDIVTRISQMSDPSYLMKPFVDFYEDLYRTRYNNPIVRMLVQQGVDLCKEAFVEIVAFKNAPGTHEAEAESMMNATWDLLKEFSLAIEKAIGLTDPRHPAVTSFRVVSQNAPRLWRHAKFQLPHKLSRYAQEARIWEGRVPDTSEDHLKSSLAIIRDTIGNVRDTIRSFKAATAAL